MQPETRRIAGILLFATLIANSACRPEHDMSWAAVDPEYEFGFGGVTGSPNTLKYGCLAGSLDKGVWLDNRLLRLRIVAWKHGYTCVIKSLVGSPIEVLWEKSVLVDEDGLSYSIAYPAWWAYEEAAGRPRPIIAPHSTYCFFITPAIGAGQSAWTPVSSPFPPSKETLRRGDVLQKLLIYFQHEGRELYYFLDISVGLKPNKEPATSQPSDIEPAATP